MAIFCKKWRGLRHSGKKNLWSQKCLYRISIFDFGRTPHHATYDTELHASVVHVACMLSTAPPIAAMRVISIIPATAFQAKIVPLGMRLPAVLAREFESVRRFLRLSVPGAATRATATHAWIDPTTSTNLWAQGCKRYTRWIYILILFNCSKKKCAS